MTQPERILWQKIRGSQICDVKFRRQFSVGRYILDFYAPSLKLAVELDGDSHFEGNQQLYDKSRDEYLRSFNIRVLRFTNLEVMENLDGVLESIAAEIQKQGDCSVSPPPTFA
jgi:very-short-patch-repair endonuclease